MSQLSAQALAIQWIEFEEGFRSEAYRDSRGNWTAGIGWLVDSPMWQRALEHGHRLTVTRETAEALAVAYVHELGAAVRERWPDAVTLAGGWTSARYAAIINMLYCLGLSMLIGWPDFVDGIGRGDWPAAADAALDSAWAREQAPARAQRVAEALRTGEPPELG